MSELVTKSQVGGNHYLILAIQPFEFAMKNQWDSAAFSILKYVTRHRNKAGIEDLKKARHIVQIRQTYINCAGYPHQHITMAEYIGANHINDNDAIVLQALDKWVTYRAINSTIMLEMIDILIAETETGTRNDSLYSGHEIGM